MSSLSSLREATTPMHSSFSPEYHEKIQDRQHRADVARRWAEHHQGEYELHSLKAAAAHPLFRWIHEARAQRSHERAYRHREQAERHNAQRERLKLLRQIAAKKNYQARERQLISHHASTGSSSSMRYTGGSSLSRSSSSMRSTARSPPRHSTASSYGSSPSSLYRTPSSSMSRTSSMYRTPSSSKPRIIVGGLDQRGDNPVMYYPSSLSRTSSLYRAPSSSMSRTSSLYRTPSSSMSRTSSLYRAPSSRTSSLYRAPSSRTSSLSVHGPSSSRKYQQQHASFKAPTHWQTMPASPFATASSIKRKRN